ncbi:hypothetical protein NQ315_007788 [Exocentrus adspersus]|uniref:Uncharacterized protein n=1 Tax=Exocentrus adspersus TaxID=1586481 RepID=A0AAV8W8I5_9CUCU|nr:hypothetical protein NQ315_007788 [Exocentrus adspersus]
MTREVLSESVSEPAPTPLIIAQYVPKFLSLNVEILKAVKNGTEQIFDTQNKIKALVDSAESAVGKQVENVNEYVKHVEEKAKQVGTNISFCVSEKESAIRRTNFRILGDCRLERALKHQYAYALKLGKEEVVLSVVVKWCIIKHPVQGDKLKTCFDDKIKDVKDKIKEFQNEVGKTIPEALQYSHKCTKKYLDALNAAIDRIYHNFKICTDEILQ